MTFNHTISLTIGILMGSCTFKQNQICNYRVFLIYLLCIRSLMMSPRWCLSSPHSPHITCSSCHKNIKIFQAKEIECQKCRKFPVTVMREQEFKVNIHWETLQTFNIVPRNVPLSTMRNVIQNMNNIARLRIYLN